MVGGITYAGRPSPYWYDGDAFFELLQAAGDRPVRSLIEGLDGCSGAKAGRIAASYRNIGCNRLSREDAASLLMSARSEARPVRPERLGAVGQPPHLPSAYVCSRGGFEYGGREPRAILPFAVEVWVEADRDRDDRIDAFCTSRRKGRSRR